MQESGEMYLETILILSKKGEVRSIDVCEEMGYSKPSVSRAVKILKSGGYIDVDDDGFITLTEEGKYVAERTYERHTVLTKFFRSIGVSEETSADDACKIEHDISDETFDKLKEFIKNNAK